MTEPTPRPLTRAQAWSILSRVLTTLQFQTKQTDALRADVTAVRDQFCAPMSSMPDSEFTVLDEFIANARRAGMASIPSVNKAYDALNTMKERFENQRRTIQEQQSSAPVAVHPSHAMSEQALSDLRTRVHVALMDFFDRGRIYGAHLTREEDDVRTSARGNAENIVAKLRGDA